MSNLQVLFLTQDFPPDRGGIARLYGELSSRFPAGRVCVSTVARRTGEEMEPAATPKVPIVRMPFTFREARRAQNIIRWVRWSARHVRSRQVTLVHVGNLHPAGYVALWLNLRLGIPYLLFVHGLDLYKEIRKCRRSKVKRLAARLLFGRAAAVVANSGHTAATARGLLEELEIKNPPPLIVVHPGTDPDRFRPSEKVPGEGPLLLSVARLVPRKGIDTALEAVARLAPSFPRLIYVVAGSGPDRERLERMAANLGIASRVRFLGDVQEDALPRLYAAADVFVLLAREEPEQDSVEGFGIVYCEASAAGVPIVAADSGGVSESVRDEETGILVPPKDPEAAARAIRHLIENRTVRQEMGRNGRRLVEEYYNWDRAAREVWDISRRLIQT
ncbi:MAG: glycosyltransferase family 4 protein [Gemmatimonadota bacterium]